MHPVVTLYLFRLWFFFPFRSMNLKYARDENVFFSEKLAKISMYTHTHTDAQKIVVVVVVVVVVVFLFLSTQTPGVNRKTFFFCVFLLFFFFSISRVIVIPSNWLCFIPCVCVCLTKAKFSNNREG